MNELDNWIKRSCFGLVTLIIFFDSINAQENVFPGTNWEKSNPESQGIDITKLDSAMNYLLELYGSNDPGGIIVIRNGYNIWSTQEINKSYNLYSAGKLWYTVAIGKMLEEKYFDMSTPVYNWEPLLSIFDDYKKIEIRHLLTFTSGYDAVNPLHMDKWGNIDDDWSSTPFDPAPPVFSPGSTFLYWDDAVHMLARVITAKLGQSIESYIRLKIMDPIGLTDFRWESISKIFPDYDEGKVNYNEIDAIGVHTSASQLARIGYLFLNQGNWNGKQILTKEFVTEATTNQIPVTIPLYKNINTIDHFYLGEHGELDGRGVSGYMFWVNGIDANGNRHLPDAPKSTFYANGGWSVLFVIPEWNMVIARTGRNQPYGGIVTVYNILIKKIGESIIKL